MGVRDTSAGRPSHHRPRGRRSGVLFGVAIAALTAGSLPLPDSWQQAWATRWYPLVQTALAPVTGLLPVAALDLAVSVLVLGVAAVIPAVRRGVVGWRSAVAACAVVAATAWLAFQVLWGWHYQSPTLEQRLAAPTGAGAEAGARRYAERARAVTAHAVGRLNALHATAHTRPWPTGDHARAAIEGTLREVVGELGVTWLPVFPPARTTMFDHYFRWAGIDGMTNPFGLEVLLNSRLLDVERPHVLAHEWAHVAGFADESDASFVAWMAGVRAGGQQEYAAWLGVLPHLFGALSPSDRTALLAALHEGPRNDLRAIAARASERWPALQEWAWKVYDRFLKANRVTEGVARYDAVTRLLLSAADERSGRLRVPSSSSGRLRVPISSSGPSGHVRGR